jgi:hypothetical protein
MNEDSSQLQLFEENDELTVLKREVLKLRRRCDQLRKGMASRYNQLAKLCVVLQEENSELKRRLDAFEKGDAGMAVPMCIEEDDYLLKLFEEAYQMK